MNAIVYSEDDTIFIKTSLTPDEAAKSHLQNKLTAKGFRADFINGSWNFNFWSFENTTEQNNKIFFTGKGFSGTTLAAIIRSFDTKTPDVRPLVYLASSKVCHALNDALKQNIDIPLNGAEGIFISEDLNSIIFFPEEIFKSCIQNLNEEARLELDELYKNSYLSKSDGIKFVQAAIAYKILTGNFPYTNSSIEQRNEDILDKNYRSIKNTVWALDSKLQEAIDSALQKNSNSKEKSKNEFPVKSFYRELGLTENGELSANGELLPVIRKSSVSQDDFLRESEKEEKSRIKKLNLKRNLKKNKSKIIITISALCTAIFVSLTYSISQMSKPTTTGLTSMQTIEMFYSAFNMLDVDAEQQSSTRSSGSKNVNIISNIYVSSKTRSMYEPLKETLPPALWLLKNNEQKAYMFGLTQFTVDGIKQSIFFKGPQKKFSGKKLTEQEGLVLKKGQKENHTAHFYFVSSDAEGFVNIMEETDKITLTFNGNRWLISELESSTSEITELSLKEFITTYKEFFYDTENSVLENANNLRLIYPWLSANSEIIEAASLNGLNILQVSE